MAGGRSACSAFHLCDLSTDYVFDGALDPPLSGRRSDLTRRRLRGAPSLRAKGRSPTSCEDSVISCAPPGSIARSGRISSCARCSGSTRRATGKVGVVADQRGLISDIGARHRRRPDRYCHKNEGRRVTGVAGRLSYDRLRRGDLGRSSWKPSFMRAAARGRRLTHVGRIATARLPHRLPEGRRIPRLDNEKLARVYGVRLPEWLPVGGGLLRPPSVMMAGAGGCPGPTIVARNSFRGPHAAKKCQ